MNFAIIGYGAAGTFAALQLRKSLLEKGRSLEDDNIFILEKSRQGLRKVKISGGGRCNVTHNQFDNRSFTKNYPRGEKELIGPFHTFNAEKTIQWFKERGVDLKTEADGRMFPTTNSSQTIIDCFEKELQKAKIEVLYQKKVLEIKSTEHQLFELQLEHEESLVVSGLMLATGSDPSGHKLAASLGHKITDLAPSLFTFKINHPLLKDLPGTSFENAEIKILGLKKKFNQNGPLLITHWGLSGPCVLKLSAWAARELKKINYKFSLTVNFLGLELDSIKETLVKIQQTNPQKLLLNLAPTGLTKKFWASFITNVSTKFPKIIHKNWSELSKKELETISQLLYAFPLENTGQSRFKEEFVECGGVSTKEINFKTMESKIIPGLFFGGELLDIDGITGGFNFQNAWTTGFIAGENLAKKV